MFGLNMMLAPVIATLSDRVPDDMRATMSAFNSAGTTVGSSLGTLIGAKFITIQIPGFATAGILMGLAGIATIVVWPREKSSKDLPPVEGGFKEFLASFRPPMHNARLLAGLHRTDAADLQLLHDLKLPTLHSGKLHWPKQDGRGSDDLHHVGSHDGHCLDWLFDFRRDLRQIGPAQDSGQHCLAAVGNRLSAAIGHEDLVFHDSVCRFCRAGLCRLWCR